MMIFKKLISFIMNEKYKLIIVILINFFCSLFTAYYGSIITIKIQGYFYIKNFYTIFIYILFQCGIFLLDITLNIRIRIITYGRYRRTKSKT